MLILKKAEEKKASKNLKKIIPSQEKIYNPEIITMEPKHVKILDFLVKERIRIMKLKDHEQT